MSYDKMSLTEVYSVQANTNFVTASPGDTFAGQAISRAPVGGRVEHVKFAVGATIETDTIEARIRVEVDPGATGTWETRGYATIPDGDVASDMNHYAVTPVDADTDLDFKAGDGVRIVVDRVGTDSGTAVASGTPYMVIAYDRAQTTVQVP